MRRSDNDLTVSAQELIVSSLTMAGALAEPLIEKGVVTQAEFVQKLSAERASYQATFGRLPDH